MSSSHQDYEAAPSPSLPVEEILVSVAESVAEAQQTLDLSSLAAEVRIREEGWDKQGMKAHWYTIPELDLDLRLAFEIGSRGELKTEMVDADYQSRYGFSLNASSLLRSRIVATPPGETAGIALLDEQKVLQRVGRIRKIVEVWDRADAPHFVVRYRAFAAHGYAGGLWYVLLLDEGPSGETGLRALLVVDDADEQILRLWTDEDVVIKEVPFTADEAARTVLFVNTASEEVLIRDVRLSPQVAAKVLKGRPYSNVRMLGGEGVGGVSLEKMKSFALLPPPQAKT